ncbi:MAG: staygreen family protein [Candidatus Thorarchaeota archaeon]
MVRLRPSKLKVRFLDSPLLISQPFPRRYTLTHSDRTGELFLTIGKDYDYKQIKGWYTRLLRDEVLAELVQDNDVFALHVYCQVGRGLGSRGYRETIFRRELPLVFEAIRYGDRELFDKESTLDKTEIVVHFCAKRSENDTIENWGLINKYKILSS